MNLRRLPKAAAWLLACLSCTAGAVLPTVPTPPSEPTRSFAAAGLLQAGFGLAVVIGLIFLFAWAVRRFGLQPSGNGRLLKVVSSAMVGQRERVVVVEIGDSWLVLGVASGQVRALHTMPAEKLPDAQAQSRHSFNGGGVFSQKLVESITRLTKQKRN